MKLRIALLAMTLACVIVATGCKPKATENTGSSAQSANAPVVARTPGPLPDKGFRAQITLPDAPLKLRTGQKETITVKVRNMSDVVWWLRGGETTDRKDNKFYLAAASRWLDKDGKHTNEEEAHNGIPRDLRPGDEAEVPLRITAPKEPGEYLLEVDMVQEGVSWFSDKGSASAKTKVTVVR